MKRILIALAAIAAVTVLFFLFFESKQSTATTFLESHWQRPIAAQGAPPKSYSDLEASLSPKACGQCHAEQWQDWQQSLHSQTVKAGLLWQFQLMAQSDANACLECHAPLAEQKALLALEHDWPAAPKTAMPNYISEDLAEQGLVCAACHVRDHKRYGPVPREGKEQTAAHQGFVVEEAFSQSEFCSSCHQFPDDWPRTNGKLRENTYQEWLASPYADQGVQCQSCHMPDRKHQWQGIHSPSMVEQALSVQLKQDGGQITAAVKNTGAGHLFPTYMVPKVDVQLVLVEADKETILIQKTIGWQVSVDLETEYFDTRLAPNQSMQLQANLPEYSQDATVELRLKVAPAEHYERSFEQSLGYAAQIEEKALSLLKQAYTEAKAKRYGITLGSIEIQQH